MTHSASSDMTPPVAAPTAPAAPSANRVDWIDVFKGLAILAVLVYHFWPPGTNRHSGVGFDGLVAGWARIWNEARAVSRSPADALALALSSLGYQGVHLFLIISGFALAASEARRGRAEAPLVFYRRRASRLLPPYYAWIFVLAVIGVANSLLHLKNPLLVGLSREDLPINLLLVRNFAEAWVWVYPGVMWFVPLILQLYLLYPFLASAMRRRPTETLVACAVITLAYRAIAVLLLDGVPVGTTAPGRSTPLLFGLARLWEFALGIWLAQRFAAPTPSGGSARARRPLEQWPLGPLLVGSAVVYAVGLVTSHTHAGLVVCDPLLGTGGFGLTLAAARGAASVKWLRLPLAYVGRNSYTIFLSHSLLMPTRLAFHPGDSFLPGFVLFVAAALLLALALDKLLQATAFVWQSIAPRLRRTPSVATVSK